MDKSNIKLGSLFDGIGGFPYAGSFFGIEPLWASEILIQAASVTKRHFPEMWHAGDITGLNGADLPPVDIITFGSPCQDLSTAGKRVGIGGARSSLFYEAIRIIDEMREATNGKYPQYAVWENVPGALSSGHPRGSDFRAVLETFTKTEIPMPDSGNWANAGMVRSNGVNIAWRLLNACMWGVPQRRRRLFLVASFGDGCPGEILFVEEGLRRYIAARGEARQGIAANAEGSAGGAMPDGNGTPRGDIDILAFAANQRDEIRDLGSASGALQAQPGMKQQTFVACREADCLTPWDVQSRRIHNENGAFPALYSGDGGGHGYTATLQKPEGGVNCLNPWETQQSRVFREDGVSPTLAGADGGGGRNPGGLVAAFLGGASAKARSIGYSEEVSPTLKSVACGFSSPCLCEPSSARELTARDDAAETERNVAAFLGFAGATAGGVGYNETISPTLKDGDGSNAAPCLCEPEMARTLTARGDGSPNIDSGPNVVAYGVCSTNSNSMLSDNPDSGFYTADTSRTLDENCGNPTCNQGGMAIVEAVGVHQNQSGEVNISDSAYTLSTMGNASGRNAPLVAHTKAASGVTAKGNGDCFLSPERHSALSQGGGIPGQGYPAVLVAHPDIAGTLCASGAGLSRPAGMASEPDLCVAYEHPAYALAGNMVGRQDRNGPNGSGISEELSFTLTAMDTPAVAAALPSVFNRQRSDLFKEQDVASTQAARQYKDATALVCENNSAVCFASSSYGGMKEGVGTVRASGGDNGGGSESLVTSDSSNGYIVRRLTPTECERLQGFPDGWTAFGHDGKEISDTRRYQMLGNSLAIPCVAYVLGSIAAQMDNMLGTLETAAREVDR